MIDLIVVKTSIANATNASQGILDRLLDVDDRVRIAAADTFCGIMGENPKLATTGLDPVLGRLRDKKLNVRKEVASQVIAKFMHGERVAMHTVANGDDYICCSARQKNICK